MIRVSNGKLSLRTLGTWGPPRRLIFLVKPLYELDAIHTLRYMTDITVAVQESNWPATRAKFSLDLTATGIKAFTRPLSLFLRGLGAATRTHYQGLARIRMAAIALAIRLHAVDHGRPVARLDELVPKYLPNLPEDPFGADGRSFAYRPQPKDQRPRLYSLGLNGIDQQGELAPDGSIDWRNGNIPFFLDDSIDNDG